METTWMHWVGHAANGATPFLNERVAALTWSQLRAAFPDAGAAVLMPNHFHIVFDPTGTQLWERVTYRKLIGILGSISLRTKSEWQPLPPPTRVANHKHLLRTLRYVALNPNRDGLIDDPLKWRWSTYRDVWGATADRWLGPIKAWNFGLKSGSGVRIHDYVSNDPDVAASGRVPPAGSASPRLDYSIYSIVEIAQAALVAMGRSSTDLQNSSEVRRYFIWLCRLVGMQDNYAMASICRLSRRAIRWHLRQKDGPTSEQLAAGLRALGEPRFRYGVFVPLPESGNKEATLGQGRANFTVYRQ